MWTDRCVHCAVAEGGSMTERCVTIGSIGSKVCERASVCVCVYVVGCVKKGEDVFGLPTLVAHTEGDIMMIFRININQHAAATAAGLVLLRSAP